MNKTAAEILSLGSGWSSEVELQAGQTLVVTGPNGVGKSAFLQAVPASGDVERFYGSRQIYFSSEDTMEIGQPLKNFFAGLTGGLHVSRFRHVWGEQHLKSVVRRVVQFESQASRDIVRAQTGGSSFAAARASHTLPLDQLNSVFEAARLAVRIDMVEGVLKAIRAGDEFNIDRMSDGERAALLLVGSIVVRPTSSFIVVDEPERHLNPSISGPLISAAVRMRPDLGFLFATHDLALIDWLRPDKIIHIQDSVVTSAESDTRQFTYTVLGLADALPENLRYALLGSRKALLLVEGTTSSEDRALYSHVYPGWNIVPREGWSSIVTGVAALTENEDYHWLRVAGFIDGDGRAEHERAKLAEKQVFCLPCPTIENVFLMEDVVNEMATAAHEFYGGETAGQRLEGLQRSVRRALEEGRRDIISRRVTWAANRALEAQKVSVDDVRRGQDAIAAIDLAELWQIAETEFETAMGGSSIFEVLQLMPVKNTKVPSVAAQALGYDKAKKYYQSVLAQIEQRAERGQRILEAVKAKLPTLAEQA